MAFNSKNTGPGHIMRRHTKADPSRVVNRSFSEQPKSTQLPKSGTEVISRAQSDSFLPKSKSDLKAILKKETWTNKALSKPLTNEAKQVGKNHG